jgi:alpha-glucoside transport system permease protein
MERILLALLVIVGAPAATAGYIVVAERLSGLAPSRIRALLRPWLWVAPAVALLTFFLIYPSINTVMLSVMNADSTTFVGLANYAYVFTDPTMQSTLRNNLIWLVAFPGLTVSLGLLSALLTDRVPYENLAKTLIFLPMAISFVAASVIWKLVYDYRPADAPQTGLLNALLTWAIPDFEPQAWLVSSPLNNLALIAVAVWTWTGFCMVIYSAALKGIPAEMLEAARVDGASELQIFARMVLPTVAPTTSVLATTMIIFALKAFDVIYVMTNGNFDTEVIANRMYKELFTVRDFGHASAIAVVLLVAVAPIMAINIRRFRAQEATR